MAKKTTGKASGRPAKGAKLAERAADPQESGGGIEAATKPDLSHIAEGLRGLAFPLADLVPDAGNAMMHPEDNLAAITGSLRQFGQTQPIVAQAGTRLIRAGHGRLEAMKRLYAAGDTRWANVAVLFVAWDNVTGVAYAIADNRSAELAQWDPAAVEKQLREINVGDEDLQAMYAQLAEDLELIVVEEDEEAEEGGAAGEVAPRFQVLINCPDETHQRELLERFEKEGYECRALTS